MNSNCIYTGNVRHSRFQPKRNVFTYKIFMLYIDLDEIDDVFKPFWLWSTSLPNVAWFRRKDHLGISSEGLGDCVRELVCRETGSWPEGPIKLLTNLRYFLYRSNPVSFYYIFSVDGQHLETVVAEVTNTPWDEQHHYVLSNGKEARKGNGRVQRFKIDKTFHVSPFLPMEMSYRWRVTLPSKKLAINIQNYESESKVLDVTLALSASPITSKSLAMSLLYYPLLTVKVSLAIYWQALKIWLKGVPFFSHPAKLK